MAKQLYSIRVDKHTDANMDGVRGFAKECIPFSYKMVLEDLMRHGIFRCKVDIPPCLLDE